MLTAALWFLIAQGVSATQPASRPVDWFRMSPDQFVQTEAAQQEVPWPEIDDKLMSAAILHETNRHRAEHDLPPLRNMPKVDEAAIMHATDMVEGGFFNHVNPNDEKKRLVIDRVKLLKLNPMFVGENIAGHNAIQYEPRRKYYVVKKGGREGISYTPGGEPIPTHTYHTFAKTIVQRWVDSPTHRENVLSPHAKFLGVGCRAAKSEDNARVHRFDCVQVFFTPMPR